MRPAGAAILRHVLLTDVGEHVDTVHVAVVPRSGEFTNGNVDTGLKWSFRRSILRRDALEAGFFTRNLVRA